MLIEIISILSDLKYHHFRFEQGIEDVLYFFEQMISYEINGLSKYQMIRFMRCYITQALHRRRMLEQVLERFYEISDNF